LAKKRQPIAMFYHKYFKIELNSCWCSTFWGISAHITLLYLLYFKCCLDAFTTVRFCLGYQNAFN